MSKVRFYNPECSFCGHELENLPVAGYQTFAWECPICTAEFHEDGQELHVMSDPSPEWRAENMR